MTESPSQPHLSLDALADLLAAEGSDADVAHVGACVGCSGRLDELATAELEVAAVLTSLPPPPVPDDLAARLQAAFDAEPPLEAAPAASTAAPAETPTGLTGSATVTPFPRAGSRPTRRWLPAAAAVVLVVGGGGLGTALLLSGGAGGGTDETSSAAGDTAGGSAGSDFGDLPRSETGNDYAGDGTLAAALPGLLGSAGTSAFDAQDSAPAPQPAAEPLQSTAAERAAEEPGAALESAGDAALDRLRTPEGLASCLSALLPPGEPGVRPLAVDYAAYSGEPALAVVLPATDAPEKVDVFVVGAGCTAGDDRTLFFTRLDRP